MNKQSKVKYKSVLLHAIAWIFLLFILPHLFIASDKRIVQPGFFPSSFFIITNLYHIGLFYLMVFAVYPFFFTKKRWWLFILMTAAILAASYYLKLYMVKEWYKNVILDDWAYRILFFPAFAIVVISIIYRLITDKITNDKIQKEVAAEQLAIKLKFLRSQISPHFIFNVLTNLVSLARKKSDLLEAALIKLSDLMRYMLYESDEDKVTLSKEITYLQGYIELQKLRFGNDISIKIEMPETKRLDTVYIEPMLLIPFVENAFKHGINIDNPLIQINLRVNNNYLDFDVQNKFDDETDTNKDSSSGIGLENIKSRLELLYANEHQLKITKQNNLFHIHLTLQLKSCDVSPLMTKN